MPREFQLDALTQRTARQLIDGGGHVLKESVTPQIVDGNNQMRLDRPSSGQLRHPAICREIDTVGIAFESHLAIEHV